jgi:hypothetical protein
LFDISNPEKPYSLDLEETINQIILQNLLCLAEQASGASDGKYDVKSCFQSVKLNGKGNWTPPTEKKENGQFNLGEDPSGQLVFTFTINPIIYK